MPTTSEELIFDNWTSLSFKRTLGNRSTPGISWLAPTWVGDHSRRLAAYKILQSYFDNASRHFLQLTDQNEIDNHREYGDAELIGSAILAALVGDDQEIFVDGAEDFDPDEGVAEGAAPAEGNPDAQAAFELEEWLRDWAWTQERMGLKIIETERNSVRLGDGVYTLGWDTRKKRVRLRVFDPGFYFPVLSDDNEDDFPERVHIAWEIEDPDIRAAGKHKIRRITWELLEFPDGGTKSYEWNEDPSEFYCAMSDATWEIDLAGKQSVDDLTEGQAVYRTYTTKDGTEVEFRQVDIGIDFLPVLHMPNTVNLQQHYGKSSVATVLQILDDIGNADTDLQASSATTGKPPLVIGGATMSTKPTYKPGEVWTVGDGTATIVDTSKSLDALLKYVEFLLKRLSTNARVPESVLGRVDISGQLAGITLALSFGPLETMVREMRLVRDEKYPLLLKFRWRIGIAAGEKDIPKKWFPARLEMGQFLPDDQSSMVTMVTTLLEKKAISTETAVAMLMTVGFDIQSANEEVARIQSRDFEGADKLQAATGDDQAVRDYLGLKGEPPAPPPAPPGPPVQPPPGVTLPPAEGEPPTPPAPPAA